MRKDYKKLELDKVLALLADEAYSAVCREEIARINPLYDAAKIRENLLKTADAFRLSSKLGTPRFTDVKDVRESLRRANQGGALSLRELLDTAALLRLISSLADWNGQYSEQNGISYLFAQLTPNRELLDKISMAVVSEDEIADGASDELYSIRRSIERQSAKIREKLDSLIKNAETRKFLQESLVTTRDGRYVVPVKTEHRNEIKGLVHDTSGSGATLFVEPMGVVEANNEIRLLKSREKDEIERIIAELSALAGGFSEELAKSFSAVIKLEMIFAKANLGARMKGIVPEITDTPLLDLRNARHPLINREKVVPITISVGEGYTSLVVTGPNTGGKTVALKTAGLLSLMAQCGLMLPVSDGSRVGVFGEIFADIGDEQSIEQSLSTFSSHMNNIIGIVREAAPNSLILLDELGSGTDPSEGGALAVAILEHLRAKGCLVIATTHYQEVKLFALDTDGVENASCEFDINTLKPTFRFIIGAPGKSNAFAIAKRLGLDEGVIAKAESMLSGEDRRFERIIESLETSRREADLLKAQIAENERKARELTEELEREKKERDAFREKEMEKTRQRALSIVEGVRQGAYALLDELEELKRGKDKSDFSDKVRGMRSKVNSTLNKLHDEANPLEYDEQDADYTPPRPLKLYDAVVIADINKKGSIVSEPDKDGDCTVLAGIMKIKTNVANLRLITEKSGTGGVNVVIEKAASPKVKSNALELDIRGMTGGEGVTETDRFIDESIMSGIRNVTIIHGKGTGALRQAIHGFLRSHKRVKSFRAGKYGEGEDGVTIVELD